MIETPGSPYKYIGTNRAGQRVVRADLILLDALAQMNSPASSEAVLEFADPRKLARITNKQGSALLVEMLADGLVDNEGAGLGPRWTITQQGRAYLIKYEIGEIFEDLAGFTHFKSLRRDPLALTITEAAPESHELSLVDRLRACHKELDRRGVPPADTPTLIEKFEKQRSEKISKFLQLLRDPDLFEYTCLLRFIPSIDDLFPISGVPGAAGSLHPASGGTK